MFGRVRAILASSSRGRPSPAGARYAVDTATPLQLGPVRSLIACGLLLIVGIAVGTAMMIDTFRDRALESSRRELENTALLLSHHLDQQLEGFVALEKDIVDDIQRLGINSPEDFRGEMSTLAMHEVLRTKVSGSFDVAGVNLFAADGTLINSSEAWPVPDMSATDRQFFQDFKSGAATGLLLNLVHGRFTRKWNLIFARRISGRNGEFLGVITRRMYPETFETFFASISLGQDSSIAMFHRDGTLLARYPHAEELMGRNFSSKPVHSQILAVSTHGTLRLNSPIDGVDRLATGRRLNSLPISVVVSTSVASVLAGWREQTRLLIIVAGLSALVVAVTLFFIVRQLLRQHRLARRQLDTALNNMTQGLVLYDQASHVVLFNQRYLEMHGLSPDVVKPGITFTELLTYRKNIGSFAGDVDEFCSTVLANVAQRKTTHSLIRCGDGRLVEIVNKPLADGGWVATMEDITERKRAEAQIAHLAHYDSLTELPNRLLFREHLDLEFQKAARGEKFALLYIDIDEFKGINDSLGHPVGDELLKAVASRLKNCVRETDFVARLGGDEFAVVVSDITDDADVIDLVSRIHQAIRQPHPCLGHMLSTDASIGVAIAPRDGGDQDQLVKNADLAMYGAKADGRRTSRFFEPAMDASAKARRTLEQDLREAIADGGFAIHYQPVVNLQSNEVTGCEALLRWPHPVRGMISPAEFIPVAEDTGLITQLGEWVLAKACAEAATWPGHIRLAVNVSPVQFKSQTFPLKIVAALAASGLPANRLELEITEAVLIHDDDAALAILHQLRDIGVRIALDDFGTGYSSLSYLQRFPFDKIKVDRSFVTSIAAPNGTASIVQAVVNIAASRSMTTTAEGVETEQQRDVLRALGCTEMQGYLFSAAKPAAEIARLLTATLETATAS